MKEGKDYRLNLEGIEKINVQYIRVDVSNKRHSHSTIIRWFDRDNVVQTLTIKGKPTSLALFKNVEG